MNCSCSYYLVWVGKIRFDLAVVYGYDCHFSESSNCLVLRVLLKVACDCFFSVRYKVKEVIAKFCIHTLYV